MITVEEAAETAFRPAWFGYRRVEVEALRSRLVSVLLESGKGRVEGLAVGADELAEASFSREIRGYERASADAFFATAAETLAASGVVVGSGYRWITATELRQMRFRFQFDGYHPAAVARVLTAAVESLESRAAGERARLTRRQLERTELPLRFVGCRCEDVETVLERVALTLAYFETAESPTVDGPGWEDPLAR